MSIILFYFFIFYFFYILLTFKIKDVRDTINQKDQNTLFEESSPVKLVTFVFFNFKNVHFLLIFCFYFFIFKLFIPALLLIFTLVFIFNYLFIFIFKKNFALHNDFCSQVFLLILYDYCSFKDIFKCTYKLLIQYPNITIFTALYAIFKNKRKKLKREEIKDVLNRIFISKITGIPHKYLIYNIKTSLLFLDFFKDIKTNKKKIRIKIILTIKAILKSVLIVIVEHTVFPLEMAN